MIRLTQEFGAHTGRQLAFGPQKIRFGRAPTNEVAFDPNVDLDASANHCEMAYEDGGFVVADLGSRNGTFVNGTRVQRQRVAHGDVIECGRGGPRMRVMLAPPSTMSAGSGGQYGLAPPPASPASTSGPFHPVAVPNAFAYAPPPASMRVDPPRNAPAFAPVPPPRNEPAFQQAFAPAPVYGAPPPFGVRAQQPAMAMAASPYGSSMGPSVGASVAAGLPAGAQIGKRTVAMMIDRALAQAGERQRPTGLRVVVGMTIAFVCFGFVTGGWFLYRQQQLAEMARAQPPVAPLPGGGGGNGSSAMDGVSAGERVASQNEGAIYLLAAQRPGANPQGFCTGFAVTHDLIATNAHCVEVARQSTQLGSAIVALRNNGRGAQVILQPVYQDARYHDRTAGLEGAGFDVGLMRAATPLAVTVHLAAVDECQRVHSGAPIYVFGFPGLTMNEASPVATLTEGLINRSTDFFDRAADAALAQKVQHTAQTTSGSSGSPIFLASGAVIAINAGSLADEERQSIVDPSRGTRVSVEVNRSSNFKYGMRADLIRAAILSVNETAP